MKVVLKLVVLAVDLVSWLYPLALLGGSAFLAEWLLSRFIDPTSVAIWFSLLPLFYSFWMLIFLSFAAIGTSLLFAGFKKPAKLTINLENMNAADLRSAWDLCRILCLYRISSIIRGLPLLNYPQLSPLLLQWINKLVLRAYSPSIQVGKRSSIVSRPQDPDLTHIGNRVVIGSECSLVAHAINTSRDGEITFSSAPIEIADHAVIGGGSYLAPGVKIGSGAILQMRSNVPAFTRIGPQEVWGGNPAIFQRMVNGCERALSDETSTASAATVEVPRPPQPHFVPLEVDRPEAQPPTQPHNGHRPGPTVPDLDHALSTIIANAIHRQPEEITDDLTSDNCMLWDSMAQMTIASAIYDRFGVDIAPDSIFQLRSRPAIKQIILTSRSYTPSDDDDLEAGSDHPWETTDPGLIPPEPAFQRPTNPELLPLLGADVVTQALADQPPPALGSSPRTLLLVSTFTPHPLKSPLELWCQAFNVPVAANFLEFDQIEQTLLSESSEFTANAQGLNVVLTRPEDLLSERDASGMARGQQLMQAIQTFAKRQPGIVVGNLPPLTSVFASVSRLSVERLRVWWQTELEQIEGVQILDFAGVIEDVGRQRARDSSMEVIARAPYSQSVYQQLGIAIARLIRKTFLPAKKVIALDCDNTLWGGVIGEDGIDGLALSDDYPGRSFRLFQQSLLAYRRRGILLVLISKNEAADVWQVFDQHPEMVLRRSDIAAYRINWQSKSENLRAVAQELNLGLDSFVFIDDSPTERLEVEANSPEVTVVPMPDNATQYVEILSKLWCFDTASLTLEDRKRTEYMQQEQERQFLQQDASTLGSYLQALQLVVHIRPATERDLPRVAQLTQKTNQFNLSLNRRSLAEVRELQASKDILVMDVSDRFGDYGLVGLAILERDRDSANLDTLLMSCRVLGRGVEDAFLSVIATLAAEQGLTQLVAPYHPGPRNSQVKQFLLNSGFSENSPTVFSISLGSLPSAPDHIKINSELPICR
jgi:FkbH-like protein